MRTRKSNRLENFDYSQNGMYFVTICTKGREELFGEIIDGKIILNELGIIVLKNLQEIPNYFENIFLDRYIIMPNHLHLIVEINKSIVGAVHEPPLQKRRNMLIPKIIGKFKMLSAKEINILTKNSGNPLWQRNYYDHIIRNEISLNKIREYILTNPGRWERDRNNAENILM
ncbi:MAG: CRISPR-associated integrase [Candidatus Moranbacteria bacterium GW2011_GWF2_36_839]|nr:MAG: CRISPR-associated integrase [Candidatus Moranbacteria bacterium GW2011_GWF1_36_78]KKQ17058.1 MAG: CRISPR-associated integrase [Candidatus Moranbacteria bacterium GW2011_GWF2_36_839]HAT73660.1 transposase [Candidatus Moranbacteria bacterium]HBY11363.1 transposase [Candidatus Moranbacteria bacterium]